MAKAAYISFLLTVVAPVILIVAPIYASGLSLPQTNGAWAIGVLAIPVVMSALPLLWRNKRAAGISVVLLGGFMLFTGFSIGLFYAPAVIFMALAIERQSAAQRT
jgi:hypothetical protein